MSTVLLAKPKQRKKIKNSSLGGLGRAILPPVSNLDRYQTALLEAGLPAIISGEFEISVPLPSGWTVALTLFDANDGLHRPAPKNDVTAWAVVISDKRGDRAVDFGVPVESNDPRDLGGLTPARLTMITISAILTPPDLLGDVKVVLKGLYK